MKQVSTRLVDDLDGSEAAGTVTFALDGRDYEIELSETNAERLRDGLGPFMKAARPAARAAVKPARRARRRSVAFEQAQQQQPAGPTSKPFEVPAAARNGNGNGAGNGAGRDRRTSIDRSQVAGMRKWARAHGYKVSDRGRLPQAVQDAYNAAPAR